MQSHRKLVGLMLFALCTNGFIAPVFAASTQGTAVASQTKKKEVEKEEAVGVLGQAKAWVTKTGGAIKRFLRAGGKQVVSVGATMGLVAAGVKKLSEKGKQSTTAKTTANTNNPQAGDKAWTAQNQATADKLNQVFNDEVDRLVKQGYSRDNARAVILAGMDNALSFGEAQTLKAGIALSEKEEEVKRLQAQVDAEKKAKVVAQKQTRDAQHAGHARSQKLSRQLGRKSRQIGAMKRQMDAMKKGKATASIETQTDPVEVAAGADVRPQTAEMGVQTDVGNDEEARAALLIHPFLIQVLSATEESLAAAREENGVVRDELEQRLADAMTERDALRVAFEQARARSEEAMDAQLRDQARDHAAMETMQAEMAQKNVLLQGHEQALLAYEQRIKTERKALKYQAAKINRLIEREAALRQEMTNLIQHNGELGQDNANQEQRLADMQREAEKEIRDLQLGVLERGLVYAERENEFQDRMAEMRKQMRQARAGGQNVEQMEQELQRLQAERDVLKSREDESKVLLASLQKKPINQAGFTRIEHDRVVELEGQLLSKNEEQQLREELARTSTQLTEAKCAVAELTKGSLMAQQSVVAFREGIAELRAQLAQARADERTLVEGRGELIAVTDEQQTTIEALNIQIAELEAKLKGNAQDMAWLEERAARLENQARNAQDGAQELLQGWQNERVTHDALWNQARRESQPDARAAVMANGQMDLNARFAQVAGGAWTKLHGGDDADGKHEQEDPLLALLPSEDALNQLPVAMEEELLSVSGSDDEEGDKEDEYVALMHQQKEQKAKRRVRFTLPEDQAQVQRDRKRKFDERMEEVRRQSAQFEKEQDKKRRREEELCNASGVKQRQKAARQNHIDRQRKAQGKPVVDGDVFDAEEVLAEVNASNPVVRELLNDDSSAGSSPRLGSGAPSQWVVDLDAEMAAVSPLEANGELIVSHEEDQKRDGDVVDQPVGEEPASPDSSKRERLVKEPKPITPPMVPQIGPRQRRTMEAARKAKAQQGFSSRCESAVKSE